VIMPTGIRLQAVAYPSPQSDLHDPSSGCTSSKGSLYRKIEARWRTA
jgi:hypothetical protein